MGSCQHKSAPPAPEQDQGTMIERHVRKEKKDYKKPTKSSVSLMTMSASSDSTRGIRWPIKNTLSNALSKIRITFGKENLEEKEIPIENQTILERMGGVQMSILFLPFVF